MNGDLGESASDDGDRSQHSSPTARMYAPTKQPLKTLSGNHWVKPKRGELGASASSGSSDDPPPYESIESSRINSVSSPHPVPSPVTNRPIQNRAVSQVLAGNPMRENTKTAPVVTPISTELSSIAELSPKISPSGSDRQNNLDKQISYKYIPLELASATTVKNSIAKNILHQSLGHGLMVIKYGRQGGPKQRILYCDYNVTKLFWASSLVDADLAHTSGIESLFDASKTVNLSEVIEVRAGTDLDPETSLAALKTATKNGNQAAMVMKQKREASIKAGTHSEKVAEKRKSLVGSLFKSHEKEDELLYGTAILRKKAKPEEFSRCLSLITNDRSIDIQCFSKKDYNLLYINLKEIVNKIRNPVTVPASLAPAVSEFRETLSTKKSVRFMEELDDDGQGGESKQGQPSTNAAGKVHGLNTTGSFASTLTDDIPCQVTSLTDTDNLDKFLGLPVINEQQQQQRQQQQSMSEELSDSGHDSHTFSDEQERELARTLSGISGLTFENTPRPSIGSEHSRPLAASHSNDERDSPYRMKAHEALQIGLILSQQEQQFGTNMYQSLQPEDEPEIEHLNSMGFSTEEAILKIFQKRFQPNLHEEEEEKLSPMSLSGKSEKGFDYNDQFVESGDAFSGSVKSMFGRQSSFFPQLHHEASDTESVAAEDKTTSRKSNKVEISLEPDGCSDDGSVNVSPKSDGKSRLKTFFGGGAAASQQRQQDMMQPAQSSPKRNNPILRLSSSDALQIGLLLSQQEEEHGVNMYDSLEVSDEATIRKLCQQGYSNDEAVLEIFNRKFGKTGPESKWSAVSPAQPASTKMTAPTPPMEPVQQQQQQQQTFSPAPSQNTQFGARGPSFEGTPYPSSAQRESFNEMSSPPLTRHTSISDMSASTHQSRLSHFSHHTQPQSYQQPLMSPPPPYQMPQQQQQLPGYPQGYQQQQQQGYPPHQGYQQPLPPPQPQYNNQPYSPYQNMPPPYQEDYGNQQQQHFRPAPINSQPPLRQGLQRTNSLAQSSFFPNDPNAMRPHYAPPPPQQQQQRGLARHGSMLSPRTSSRSNMLTTLTDDEAVNMALLLSQQETDHGINMYDSLRASDEQELQHLIASGYTNEQAVLFIFEKRYPPRNAHRPQPFAHQQNAAMARTSMYNMQVPPSPAPYQPPMQPVYGSSPVRPVVPMQQPMQQSMYAPAPVPAPAPTVMSSVIQQQHQLQSMYSSQYIPTEQVPLGGHDPRMMRPPGAAPQAAQQPLQRQQSTLVPVRENSVPVVSVVSAVPIDDADNGTMAQATHVAYSSTGGSVASVASAVPARSMERSPPVASRSVPRPPPAAAGPVTYNPPSSSSNNSVSSGGAPPKLVKKRSIFNFVTSGNGGEHTSGGGRQRYKDADVHTITKMGYTKDQAVWALLQSNNNLPMAIEALCNS